MAYTDQLSLADAKIYLRVDASDTDNDALITNMINSASIFFERQTNIILDSRNIEYPIDDFCVRVYDYPITAVVKGIDDDDDDVTLTYKSNYWRRKRHLYNEYYDIDSEAEILVLTVGYSSGAAPEDVLLVLKEIVSDMYYAQETDKTIEEMLSPRTMVALNQLKRFVL